ncbi:COG4653 Predicted phage phi-C31 gp36 major capsid-like protein [uncultured Caudovirales phage]|uniref:COG4653 Predicted phage phi-C31 gp36 major capsid-like protein n=1 Tax=uncultured Caudovirales phage TaxID=2100421 RepID=A0A6J5QXM1_9CAUD|nr:COG4653 Predicted phage phi-C31 gp36 major capsid-like protein [uncultured Caudovirales phage]CAB4219237.1 COG4653 Predicted phage phi-C31 gp36 major capsid-like protein [uncultured Caudovirales phage]
MSVEKIIEKVDAIEQSNLQKIEEVKSAVATQVEAAKVEMEEKFNALEAKVSSIQMPEIIKAPAKTVRGDVNRMVKEQLKDFYKNGSRLEKEIKLWESVEQHEAYLREASTLTGSGAGIGGRTAYDPVFHALRLMNPMRGVSRNVSTDGSTYQFRAKTGNAGPAWGYTIQNNGSATTESTNIWQLNMADLNVQFPIRTAALDDIDGLESNVVDDMLSEFSASEGQSMIINNDQSGSTTTSTGGTSGLRGLNSYPGSNSSYTGGTISTAAFGSSGTATSDGLHSLATYDQITTNGFASANNVTFDDIINFIHLLPQQYWTPSAKFVVSPLMLAGIRGLKDDNGTPIFERMSPLVYEGIVGKLLGFDVVVNNYIESPVAAGGSAGTNSQFPMYFGDWSRGHTIVDRLNMVLRRYDQTAPGFITFFGEKRLSCSVVDPFSIIRYRSTATGA